MLIRKQSLALIVLLGAAAATPALAHHSFAMFDAQKTITLSGTVKEWRWSNPHSWIEMTVQDENGKVTEWSIELTSPAMLARRGWKHNTLMPGDKITLSLHPLRTGTTGGQLVSITLPNGQTMDDRGGRERGTPAGDSQQ
jgi:hypothetical protein